MQNNINLPPMNLEQEIAVEKIVSAIRKGDRMVSLSGAAGTGKTLTIRYLLERIGYSNSPVTDGRQDVSVCAFTNKAVKVLHSKGITGVTTIHRKFYRLVSATIADEKECNTYRPCHEFSPPFPAGKGAKVKSGVWDACGIG